jgi:hypothetical protein
VKLNFSRARSSSTKLFASSTRFDAYILTGYFRKIGALHESQRYTTPTWLGRLATSSPYCGTDTAVMCEKTWQCGQLSARLRSWSWCSRLLAST